MIDNKKEQERDELHRTIWNMANDLRGSVDGWDFKQYVLGMLFYRYISENFIKYVNAGELEAGNRDFDYAKLDDEVAEEAREDLVQSKGYFILPSQLFCNVRENASNNENLNETLESVFRNIEGSAQGHDSEDDFKGLFDDIDVNSNKLGGTVAKENENNSLSKPCQKRERFLNIYFVSINIWSGMLIFRVYQKIFNCENSGKKFTVIQNGF